MHEQPIVNYSIAEYFLGQVTNYCNYLVLESNCPSLLMKVYSATNVRHVFVYVCACRRVRQVSTWLCDIVTSTSPTRFSDSWPRSSRAMT